MKNSRHPKNKPRTNGSKFLAHILLAAGSLCIFTAIAYGMIAVIKSTDPSSVNGNFNLISQNGAPVSEKDFFGKPHIIFFGYTHCQDICPATLLQISDILRELGNEAKIDAIFVTVDPDRDTPEVLKDYLSNFDPRITGLSGDRKSIEKALASFHIYSKVVSNKYDGYSVNHTNVVFLIDKLGQRSQILDISKDTVITAAILKKYL
jgi:protein SCO1/2